MLGSNMHKCKVLLKIFLSSFVVIALLIQLPVYTLMICSANENTQSDSISTIQDTISIAEVGVTVTVTSNKTSFGEILTADIPSGVTLAWQAEYAGRGTYGEMFSHHDAGLDIGSGVTDTARLLSSNTRTPIMGEPVLTAEQLAAFLLSRNPNPRINCTALELAQFFIDEGNKEGVRGDIAFFQAIHETGWFRFGGQVLPEQNNFAGIGAVNHSPVGAGAWFDTPEIGVRAQIHHLKAYATTEPFVQENVSPRYRFVTRGIAPTWEDLNGRWAVPGTTYAQRILRLYRVALEFAESEALAQIA